MRALLTMTYHSDVTATPELQAEQIQKIYPIVDGQGPVLERNRISAKAPEKIQDTQVANEKLQDTQPVNEKPQATQTNSGDATNNDLIDFGADDSTTSAKVPEKKKDEIEELLTATGKKPSDGPLIDLA
jgi:hypothetical protein